MLVAAKICHTQDCKAQSGEGRGKEAGVGTWHRQPGSAEGGDGKVQTISCHPPEQCTQTVFIWLDHL